MDSTVQYNPLELIPMGKRERGKYATSELERCIMRPISDSHYHIVLAAVSVSTAAFGRKEEGGGSERAMDAPNAAI